MVENFYRRGYTDALTILSQGIDPIHPIILSSKPENYKDPHMRQHEWMLRKRAYTPIG